MKFFEIICSENSIIFGTNNHNNQITTTIFNMSVRQFASQLTIVTIFVSVVLWILSALPLFYTHQQLSWMSLILFVAISMVMFFSGRWGAAHENKGLFISLMYIYMGFKMLLSIMLIMLYYLYAEPESNLFILPFFTVYFIFTIFESYFLMKLSDAK
jgi:uncharacterized membrane protein YfcA